jgi:tetratricopeptide (TPR) repeat protein
MKRSRLTLAAATVCGTLLAGGCAAPETATLPQAVNAYRQGRYQDGYAAATAAMRRTEGVERQRASYVAGLCSYRVGERTEAELRFLMAAESPDAATAGAARAMVGVMLLERGEHDEAAGMFERAAADLDGEDRARASEFASAARRGEGTADQAHRVAARPMPRGFTLQAGAFRDHDHARSVAVGLEPVAARMQLGTVRVIRAFDGDGPGLYLVQLGEFATRQDAASMRQRLGTDYIVAPMGRTRIAGEG